MPTSDAQLVTFRGGFVASLDVVSRLLAVEARGGRFIPAAGTGGGFKVEPREALTSEDCQFFAAHRDEARRVLAYQADDSHLFTDGTQAQPARMPGPQEKTA